jgi:hypothetical protein
VYAPTYVFTYLCVSISIRVFASVVRCGVFPCAHTRARACVNTYLCSFRWCRCYTMTGDETSLYKPFESVRCIMYSIHICMCCTRIYVHIFTQKNIINNSPSVRDHVLVTQGV